ncbi:DUF3526 domain-containing protein [Aquincola sp. S2]|uniref:DUF3526 domain-containing protein n=1 Tax=Pseudaquabacterium terrae TaxID=2732868 RepID=A0ABX2EER3_9BURK|nr:DUF3526 domain-containing protein [Aquabacterium terrae]NRF67090.1 DUF3526 domain-containing protein [Aquabacterium terrae]
MILATLRLECRIFFATPAGGLAFVLMLALSVCALVAGESQHALDERARQAHARAVQGAFEAWRGALVRIEATGIAKSPHEAQPMNLSVPVALAPGPLPAFALGLRELLPSQATLSPWNTSATVFPAYQFQNPTLLALGRFDLNFVTIVLLPLLMIAVSSDTLGRERARGTLRLLLAQGARLESLAGWRLILRNTWIVLPLMLASAAYAASAAPVESWIFYLLWLAATGLYAGVWLGLIALAVAWYRRTEAVAASLVAAWTAVVLVLPAVLAAAAEASYPAPSRLAYLSELRAAQIDASREVDRLTRGYLLDHPELTISDQAAPSFHRDAYLANLEVERRTASILAAFDRSRADRQSSLARAQYASAALVAQRLLNRLAGADEARYWRFQAGVRACLAHLADAVGPSVVSGQRIRLAEVEGATACAIDPPSLRELIVESRWPVFYLVSLAAVLLLFARRRLRRPPD